MFFYDIIELKRNMSELGSAQALVIRKKRKLIDELLVSLSKVFWPNTSGL